MTIIFCFSRREFKSDADNAYYFSLFCLGNNRDVIAKPYHWSFNDSMAYREALFSLFERDASVLVHTESSHKSSFFLTFDHFRPFAYALFFILPFLKTELPSCTDSSPSSRAFCSLLGFPLL